MADDEAAARRGPAAVSLPQAWGKRRGGNDGALLPLPLRAEGLAGAGERGGRG